MLSRPLSEKHKVVSVNELDFNIGPWIVTLDEFLTDKKNAIISSSSEPMRDMKKNQLRKKINVTKMNLKTS